MGCAVVRELLASRRNRNCLGSDRQLTLRLALVGVLSGNIRAGSIGDCIAERIVNRSLRNVRDLSISSRRDRHNVARAQGNCSCGSTFGDSHGLRIFITVRHRVLVLRVLRTVVRPFAVGGLNLQRRRISRHINLNRHRLRIASDIRIDTVGRGGNGVVAYRGRSARNDTVAVGYATRQTSHRNRRSSSVIRNGHRSDGVTVWNILSGSGSRVSTDGRNRVHRDHSGKLTSHTNTIDRHHIIGHLRRILAVADKRAMNGFLVCLGL